MSSFLSFPMMSITISERLERLKLEEGTENMGVCRKEQKDIFLPIVYVLTHRHMYTHLWQHLYVHTSQKILRRTNTEASSAEKQMRLHVTLQHLEA